MLTCVAATPLVAIVLLVHHVTAEVCTRASAIVGWAATRPANCMELVRDGSSRSAVGVQFNDAVKPVIGISPKGGRRFGAGCRV